MVITGKNKKIRQTSNIKEKEKILADQEEDQHVKERNLAEKESELANKSMDLEQEKTKLAQKAEAMKKAVLEKLPEHWKTPTGQTLRKSLKESLQSIIDSDEEDHQENGMNTVNTMESGTGLSMEQENMDLDSIPEDLQDLRDEDLAMNLLDQPDEEDGDGDSGVLPEGQVILTLIKLQTKAKKSCSESTRRTSLLKLGASAPNLGDEKILLLN